MNKIIVEFSGWVECDSDKVMFEYIGSEDNSRQLITGTEWLKLSEDDRDDYILEDCIEAQKTSVDGSYEHIDVIIVDENHNEVTAIRTHS
jgi:hypothetical protein